MVRVRVRGLGQKGRRPEGQKARRRSPIFISTALAGLPVGVRELEADRWLVSYAHIDLGVCDLSKSALLPVESEAVAS